MENDKIRQAKVNALIKKFRKKYGKTIDKVKHRMPLLILAQRILDVFETPTP